MPTNKDNKQRISWELIAFQSFLENRNRNFQKRCTCNLQMTFCHPKQHYYRTQVYLKWTRISVSNSRKLRLEREIFLHTLDNREREMKIFIFRDRERNFSFYSRFFSWDWYSHQCLVRTRSSLNWRPRRRRWRRARGTSWTMSRHSL